MACPMCFTSSSFGGLIGGYFGLSAPTSTKGRITSAIITASLVSITVIVLKVFFNISLCIGGILSPANIARVMIKTSILGLIYSIGVNYLLNRYVFHSISNQHFLSQSPLETHCCCEPN